MITSRSGRYRIVISLRYGTLGHPGLAHDPAAPRGRSSDDVNDKWVLFEVYDQSRSATSPVGLIEATPESIGLAHNYRDAVSASETETYTLPPHVVAALMALITFDEPESEVVWLQIARAASYLPAVPWERLLLYHCGIASIRLGSGVSPLFVSPPEIDSVLCFSCPIDDRSGWTADGIVELFLQMMPKPTAQRSTTLHVFADKDIRPILQKNQARLSAINRVIIYTPRPDAAYLDLERSTSLTRRAPKDRVAQSLLHLRHTALRVVRALGGEAPPATPLENPWLVWMRDELCDIAVDYVHFVCHGYLGRDAGGLVFANAFVTDDPRWLRHVSARELNDFLSRIGTWSVGASSPPSNPFVGGIRYCFDDLAALRLGPIVLHDMQADDARDALLRGYRLFVDPYFAGSAAITAWWHPDYEYLAREASSDRMPAWATKTRRAIELTSTSSNKIPHNDYEAALLKGVSAALETTSNLLSERTDAGAAGDRTR